MFLVTHTRTTTKRNDETGELEARVAHEANVEDSIEEMIEMKRLGHDRLKTTRFFEFKVDDDGLPSIGDELR